MGAMNDNVVVKIVGDASGVTPAVETTVSSLGNIEPLLAELTASMKALTAQMAEGFTAGAASARKLAVSVEEAKAAATGAGVGFTGMVSKIHEGAESVRTFQMRAKEFAEVYVALFAVDKIAEWISKMGEAAERVMHLSQQFGMSVAQVQQLQGVATATGIPVDALTKGMGFLDRNLATAAAGSKRMQSVMEQVGISFSDGRTQMEKLAVVADKFKDMDDGPKKVALAMQLFGRSGRELIPVLNLGSAGIEQLNEKMTEYGVVNDDAVAKGAVLAENVNETKLGFMGVGNVLTQALAPAFTDLVAGVNELIRAFIQSYKEGGIVAVIMGAISASIEIAIDVIEALGSVFKAIWDVIVEILSDLWHDFEDVFGASVPKNVNVTRQILNVFKDTMIIVKDAIEMALAVISAAFRGAMQVIITFGKVAYDAMTLNWGAIEGDWQKGMARLDAIVQQEAGKIKKAAAEMAQAIAAAANGQALGPAPTGVPLPKAGGDFDFDPSKGAKEKKPKDDLVQKLEEELTAKKTAWQKEQLAQGTAQEFSLESERDFWAKALARTDLSAKDKAEIEKKWIAASQAIQKDEIAKKLDGYKADIEAAGTNSAAKLKIMRDEAAFVHRMYGDKSKEAAGADAEVVRAERQAAEQLRQLWDNYYKHEADLKLLDVDMAEAAAQQQVDMGVKTKGQLLAQEKQFENQRFEIRRQELEREKALIDPNRDPVAYQKVSVAIELLERQHQQRLTQIDQQAVLQRTQIERNGVNQLSSSWASAFAKMATLQASFGATFKSLWQGLQQAVESVIEQIVEKFIAGEITKLIFGKTTAQATIASEAAKAGAGGVASMAAAPWPIDMGAPAFGAAMSSAAMAFSGLNSAEGGDWKVKAGLYNLHADEMVLPAWAAQGLRGMIGGSQSVPANFNAPNPANDMSHAPGHTFIFNGPANRAQLKRWFIDNHQAVGAGVHQFVRQLGNTSK